MALISSKIMSFQSILRLNCKALLGCPTVATITRNNPWRAVPSSSFHENTKTYFEDFDSVVNDFIGNTLSFQPGNSSCLDIACVKNQCLESEIWSHKLICTFPLMTWWISGTLSVVVLAITYLAEVISTIVSKKFDHFFALYSRVCCKKHHWGTVIVHALLLPLGQQMASLIYSQWIKTFVGYWQNKNTETIANLPSKNNECIKHCDRAEGEFVKKIM